MSKFYSRKSQVITLLLTSALALSGCSTSQPEEAKESASASAMATASATESTSVEAVDPQADFASKSASLMATACDELDLYRKAWADANPDPNLVVEPTSYYETRENFLNSLAIAASYDKRWTDALISFNQLDSRHGGWITYDNVEPVWYLEEDTAAWNVLKSACQIARAGAPS
jgi:hypothetical protein